MAILVALLGPAIAWGAGFNLRQPWPDAEAVRDRAGQAVEFPSHSPFTPVDIGADPTRDPPTVGRGVLFLPHGAGPAAPAPAVVMLHGAGGVREER
ncbi:MAG: hypothetical protein IRY94_08375, partial [Rhodospirillaceae bacterium]|nr:hypothetical protein [Rhodospirillaceae bacterium]